MLAEYARDLSAAFAQTLGPWVRNAVEQRYGGPLPLDIKAEADAAADEAATRIAAEINTLLATDIDSQRTSPLAIARQVVRLATQVLERAGVPPVSRDPNAVSLHPDDIYDLTPGTFADFGPEVHEPGIRWGAAKAYVHLSRRKAEGKI